MYVHIFKTGYFLIRLFFLIVFTHIWKIEHLKNPHFGGCFKNDAFEVANTLFLCKLEAQTDKKKPFIKYLD